MTDEPMEIVRGSGNVFADFGHANAAVEQLKALLATEIIGVLDDRPLTVRKAEDLTGIAAADFSRIRKTKLDRFTIDRLMTVLTRLEQDVDVQVTSGPIVKPETGHTPSKGWSILKGCYGPVKAPSNRPATASWDNYIFIHDGMT